VLLIVLLVHDQDTVAPATTSFKGAETSVALLSTIPLLNVTAQLADRYETLFNAAVTDTGHVTFACAASKLEIFTVAFLLTPPTPSNKSCAEPD
jgi:hypothetical protein